MISSFAKVMGLQRRQKRGPVFHLVQERTFRHGKVIRMTTVILVKPLISFEYEFFIWKSVAHVLLANSPLLFYGLPIMTIRLWKHNRH